MGSCADYAARKRSVGRALPTIRLTRKFTECLNGVDLSAYRVGDVIEVPEAQAHVLIAEGCAERIHEIRKQTDRRKGERRRSD
jgi:hypothetical protein